MTDIRAIVVSVNFGDLLRITLSKNSRFFSECVVVTTADDHETQDVVAQVPNARCFITDAFYRHGAVFNKGLAMEEGFDELGRHGWIWIHDADILLPDNFRWPENMQCGLLYGAPRRFIDDVTQYREGMDWSTLPLVPDADRISGFFQAYHADDRHIAQLPWYDVTFSHSGGGDGYFDQRWPRAHTRRLPYEVLHLGPWCSSWFGRAYKRTDGTMPEGAAESHELIEQYQAYKNWNGTTRPYCDFNERVEVPGATPSEFVPRPWNGPRLSDQRNA